MGENMVKLQLFYRESNRGFFNGLFVIILKDDEEDGRLRFSTTLFVLLTVFIEPKGLVNRSHSWSPPCVCAEKNPPPPNPLPRGWDDIFRASDGESAVFHNGCRIIWASQERVFHSPSGLTSPPPPPSPPKTYANYRIESLPIDTTDLAGGGKNTTTPINPLTVATDRKKGVKIEANSLQRWT